MPALGILAGTGYVSIVPDLTRFNSQLAAGVNSSLAGLSKSGKLAQGLSSIGSSLTKFVTLPLGIAGAASVKMALDFESSFAKIGALAGNLGVSLEEAKQHVLDLAGQTAQSPKELTDALYFVASAGLQADQVMSVLDASARGAAVGMGTASQIAQTLTSVLNAYAGTGLTAGNAMNIMTQAVKSGKAEMTDFATGLGPVIGVAAQAGVSFNDLAAAIAQATNLGLPFDRAVTGMRFLIQSLEAPLPKAVKALDSVGVSVSDLHAQLAQPGGLQTALQELAVKFDLSTEAGRAGFAAVVGGARGSVVAMDLVGKHTEQTNKIVRDLGAAAQDSSTVFEQAFAKVTGTSLFKAQAAIASFQASFTKLGIALLPVATKLIGFVTNIANAFASLSPHAQDLAIKIGLIAFAAGPVLKIFGGLLGIGLKVAGMLTSVGAAAATTAVSTAAASTAASTLSFGFVSAAENAAAATTSTTAAGGAMGLLGVAAIGAAAGIGLLILKHKLDSDLAKQNAAAVVALATAMTTGKTSAEELANQLKNENIPEWAKAGIIVNVLSKVTAEAARQVDVYRQQVQQAIGPLSANTAAMVDGALAAGDSARAMAILESAANVYFASLGPMATAEQQNAAAAKQDAVEHKGLALAMGGVSAVTAPLTNQIKGLESAHQAAKNAASQQTVEDLGLAGAMGRMTGAAGTTSGSLGKLASAHQQAKDAATQQSVEDAGLSGAMGRLTGAAGSASGQLNSLAGSHNAAGAAAGKETGLVNTLDAALRSVKTAVTTVFSAPGLDKISAAVFNYKTLLGNVPRTITTVFKTVGSAVGGGSSGGGSSAPQPPKYKPPIFKATGGVFPPGYAGGALFRTPFGHEFIAGEGTYPTLFGRGGEIVTNRGALPLPDRIIDRLGDRIGAVSRAHWVDDMNNMSSTTPMPRGGVRGRPIVIHTHVHVDRREIARAVANSSVWDD